jgi:hypothetical protein
MFKDKNLMLKRVSPMTRYVALIAGKQRRCRAAAARNAECMKQYAHLAEETARFHSSLQVTSLCIAENVIRAPAHKD